MKLLPAFVAVVVGGHARFEPIVSADEQLSFAASFGEDVRPVLAKFCFRCHGPDEQEARIRLDKLSTDLVLDKAAAATWQKVLKMLTRGKMPPEDEPQPDEAQRRTVTNWLRTVIDKAVKARWSTDGRTVLRRLNRTEYQNTMSDLLGFDMNYVRDIPPDGLSPDGFLNNGSTLRMTAIQLEYHLEAVRKALARVIVTGPEPEVFHHTFTESGRGDGENRKKQVTKNRVGRSNVFLARMEPDYPEEGKFFIRVRVAAEFKCGKGLPVMRVLVGYRPDTEILFRSAGTVEVSSPRVQTFEFRGRIENFPRPVRGQSK